LFWALLEKRGKQPTCLLKKREDKGKAMIGGVQQSPVPRRGIGCSKESLSGGGNVVVELFFL
jgi:hypothetical protein